MCYICETSISMYIRFSVYSYPIIDVTSVTNQLIVDILEGHAQMPALCINALVYRVQCSIIETRKKDPSKRPLVLSSQRQVTLQQSV